MIASLAAGNLPYLVLRWGSVSMLTKDHSLGWQVAEAHHDRLEVDCLRAYHFGAKWVLAFHSSRRSSVPSLQSCCIPVACCDQRKLHVSKFVHCQAARQTASSFQATFMLTLIACLHCHQCFTNRTIV